MLDDMLSLWMQNMSMRFISGKYASVSMCWPHFSKLLNIMGSSIKSPAAEKSAKIVKYVIEVPFWFGKNIFEGRFRYNFNQRKSRVLPRRGWTHANHMNYSRWSTMFAPLTIFIRLYCIAALPALEVATVAINHTPRDFLRIWAWVRFLLTLALVLCMEFKAALAVFFFIIHHSFSLMLRPRALHALQGQWYLFHIFNVDPFYDNWTLACFPYLDFGLIKSSRGRLWLSIL